MGYNFRKARHQKDRPRDVIMDIAPLIQAKVLKARVHAGDLLHTLDDEADALAVDG